MTTDQVRQLFEKKYTVGAFIFIEDLEHQPSSTLYRSLIELKQDSFPDNYRFVFANFNPVSAYTLEHIVSTLDYIDIPRFFVTVVSTQSDVVDYFKSKDISSQLLAAPIQHTVIHQATPQFNTKNQMCAHAWAGFWADSDGSVKPCCDYSGRIKKPNWQDFNIQTDTVEDIVKSPYMRLLREQFREGIRPTECSTCWNRAKSGAETRIELSPYKLQNVYGTIDWETEGEVSFVGGHLGNLCNLGCVICSAGYSSTIAAEDVQHSPIKDKKKHPSYQLLRDNRWPSNSDTFWQKIKSRLPQVKNFEFLGGEPFLLKENIEFLQYLIDQDYCQNSIVQFSTNGTQFPDVCYSLHKFQRAEITFSIDNIGPKFEYERYRADWIKVKENIAKFIEQRNQNPMVKLNVCVTVSIQNVLDLPETIAELKSIGLDVYYINIVNSPEQLSIANLTPRAKQLVLDKLIANPDDKFQIVIDTILKGRTSNGQSFCDFIRHKDLIRNTNFLDTHREIGEAMGYIYKHNLL